MQTENFPAESGPRRYAVATSDPVRWADRKALTAIFLLTTALPLRGEDPQRTVDFNRDVRPILSDTCYTCHGPDEAKLEADLRLDRKVSVFAKRDGKPILVPGKSAESELFRRITAAGDEQMPPAESGRKLTSAQIETLRRWIDEGAEWGEHWSFSAPKRPAVPEVKLNDWPRNAIDRFILRQLEYAELAPSPEAPRETLLRRITLDLTGLPPTPDEVRAFIDDSSPDAYERVVDRLLASPRYGERIASRWLDAARYADTSGYQTDGERHMWRWRDWVIDACNANMPFDQFTIEQIAGDMLPNATLDQKIASGFNRNHRGNGEGGIIPEEYAVEYVVDRVETTSTVWLGLTMGCARCHDHKYDPIRQKEFYQVYAFFNNIPEKGKAVKVGNSPPMILAPTADDQRLLAALEQEQANAQREWQRLQPVLAAAQKQWESESAGGLVDDWTPAEYLTVRYELDEHTKDSTGRPVPAKFQGGNPVFVPGRVGKAAEFDGKRSIDAGDIADFGYYDKFSAGAWINLRGNRGGTVLSRMLDIDQGEGWSIKIVDRRVQVLLVKRWLDDSLRVESSAQILPDEWHHVFFTYDGSRVAAGIRIYIDGKPAEAVVKLDELNQSFQTKNPLCIGGGHGPNGRFHGFIDDVRVYSDVLPQERIALVASTEPVRDILAIPVEKRSETQSAKLAACFLERYAPEPIRQLNERMLALAKERALMIEQFPTVMVMQELPEPRPAYILARGQYDKPGERVSPGIPAALPPLPTDARPDRLNFARWLVAADQPLTARVAVNRAWQMFFGAGLVRTMEDFGSQGERPSHPELLDWLATEYTRTGWDTKALHRLIVTSSTYRQSSRITKELRERDPENRLLARGPRVRLSAEMIRDQALAASGLLVERLGGPSVKPYQPAGLWAELTGGTDYVPDKGLNLYRRSLYTYWKRTVTPPTMSAFDASPRETCVVRETRTNTPLQSLALMNDVTFVEASRVLAERIMSPKEFPDANAPPSDRVLRAFLLLTGRLPQPEELKLLVDAFESHKQQYTARADDATKLARAGESPQSGSADVTALAAYTTIANLILNLDEAITKE